jgi:ketosteroid isomerase-like protein
MKKTWIACLLAMISVISLISGVSTASAQTRSARGPSATRAAGTATTAKKAVAAREEQWLQSHKTNNPDLVAPLLGKSIVVTSSDGRVHDKAEMLAIAKKTRYDAVDYSDLKVSVFGNTAIATGGFDARGTDEAGKPFEAHERWTDTWLRMPSGKWLCVASSGTPIKK